MKRDIIRVFIPNIIKMFVTIIAAFIIPRYLNIEEYGYIKLFQLYVSYAGLSSLGFCDGVYIKYGGKALKDISSGELADEQTTLLIWQVIITLLISSIALLQKDFLVFMFGLSVVPNVMLTYFLTLYQTIGMFREYSRLYNIQSVLTMIAELSCIYVFKVEKGLVFVIVTVVINYIVFIYILLSFDVYKKITLTKFQWNLLKENVRTGILIAAGNMAYIVFMGIDKWFVKSYAEMRYFSYYSFAAQLLSAINMFANPIAYTLFSHLSKMKSCSFEFFVKRAMLVWLLFLLNGVFVIKAIIRVYLIKYAVAIPVVVILFLSQVFYSLNYAIYVNLFKVYKKQKQYFRNLLLIIFISIFLNYFFYFQIKKEIISFAYATAVSMLIWALLNLLSFPYLRLQKRDLTFAIMAIILYMSANKNNSFLIGMLIYGLGFAVLVYIFMHDIFKYIIGEVQNLREKLIKRK